MINQEFLYNELVNKIGKESIHFSEPIKNHVYTKLGGKADILIMPSSVDALKTLLKIKHAYNLPITILGGGSNVIIKDGGIRGLTIGMSNMVGTFINGNYITVKAGTSIIETSKKALNHSLSGLEFACGIPGSVGGAIYMNAGAYGGQISDSLEKVTVMTQTGEVLILHKEELSLGYRKSIFMKNEYIILEAEFKLREGDHACIKEKMDELTKARELKQPLEYPSCGSVFKRPPGYFAGKLIQESNLQGKRIGGAEVSRKHAGFIVNIDNATSQDYLKLIDLIMKTVKHNFNVELETEVIVLGEDL